MHLWLLIKDAWRANSWKDKLRIWFMPLGWRPADVAEKHPVFKIDDVYHFDKFNPSLSGALTYWSLSQLFILLLLISYLYGNIADFTLTEMFLYGGFVFMTVYALTELMDKNPNAWIYEFIKNAFGGYLFVTTGNWFGIDQVIPGAQYAVAAYLIISMVVVFWFVRMEIANTPRLA